MSDYKNEIKKLLCEFRGKTEFKKGDIFVVGCSTSEVIGEEIGSSSSKEVALEILPELMGFAKDNDLYLAIQGCEHINRAIVVEEECADLYDFTKVNVVPYSKAGGTMSEAAMEMFENPVVVENIKGKAVIGIDIGDTFIGMHMRSVVVPIRLSSCKLGEAHTTFAKTRNKLIGGDRANHY